MRQTQTYLINTIVFIKYFSDRPNPKFEQGDTS
eukprot:SAG31_NODE_29184_length_399_cov_1.036667_1_plen_32_part_01